MAQFSFASPLRTDAPPGELQSRALVPFTGPLKSSISTDNPLIKAALAALGQAWPQAVHFHDLLAAARAACGEGAGQDSPRHEDEVRVLGEMLLRAYAGGIIEMHGHPPRFSSRAGERPVASPLARLQSLEADQVVNLRHYNIAVENPVGRFLLGRLDGSRDRAALVGELAALVESGALTMPTEGTPVHDERQVRERLAAELERQLKDLAERALLVA
jgi:hypothetical protein